MQTVINFSHRTLFQRKTVIRLKNFVNDCPWNHFFASNLPQTTSNTIYFNIFVTLKPFTQFQPKIKAIKLQKSYQIDLTW